MMACGLRQNVGRGGMARAQCTLMVTPDGVAPVVAADSDSEDVRSMAASCAVLRASSPTVLAPWLDRERMPTVAPRTETEGDAIATLAINSAEFPLLEAFLLLAEQACGQGVASNVPKGASTTRQLLRRGQAAMPLIRRLEARPLLCAIRDAVREDPVGALYELFVLPGALSTLPSYHLHLYVHAAVPEDGRVAMLGQQPPQRQGRWVTDAHAVLAASSQPLVARTVHPSAARPPKDAVARAGAFALLRAMARRDDERGSGPAAGLVAPARSEEQCAQERWLDVAGRHHMRGEHSEERQLMACLARAAVGGQQGARLSSPRRAAPRATSPLLHQARCAAAAGRSRSAPRLRPPGREILDGDSGATVWVPWHEHAGRAPAPAPPQPAFATPRGGQHGARGQDGAANPRSGLANRIARSSTLSRAAAPRPEQPPPPIVPPPPLEVWSDQAVGGWTRSVFIPPPDLGVPASLRPRPRPSTPPRRPPSPRPQREPPREPPQLCYTRSTRRKSAAPANEPSLEAVVTW